MGCAESKLDSDDTVRRCKDRRRLIKQAVYARHRLSAAHSSYLLSLRLTGSAFLTFASGEPLSLSNNTPAVYLRPPPTTAIPKPPPSTISTPSTHHQVQPPPPPRRQKTIKVPHILSESSRTSSPPLNNNNNNNNNHINPPPNSTYSTTPSQLSSVWNWDTFYPPPSPLNSDYFDRLQSTHTKLDHTNKSSVHDQFTSSSPSDTAEEEEDDETEQKGEEVHCSGCAAHVDDDDHYTITSCSSDDEDETEHLKPRSDFSKNESTNVPENPKSMVESTSENYSNVNLDKRVTVRQKDFTEIVAAINECFGKAASSGDHVSGILEREGSA